jgi:lysophospholipase L1-like esterase
MKWKSALSLLLALALVSPAGGWPVRSSGGGITPIIADAVGVWDADDYEAVSRKVIKNSRVNGTTDPNLWQAPRRQFSKGFWNKLGGTVVTDSDQAAPDGTTQASTITSAGGVDWAVGRQSISVPAGTYTVAVSAKYLGGGSAGFIMGVDGSEASKTATGSWQRFTTTLVHGGGTVTIWAVRAPGGGSAANLAIADAQLFAGSSDLNATALSAPPQVTQSLDLVLGRSNWDTTINVSGGVAAGNTLGLVSFPTAKTMNAYTVLYVAERTATPTDVTMLPIISDQSDWTGFSVGPSIAGSGVTGSYYATQYVDRIPLSSGINTGGSLFMSANKGLVVGAHRFDRTTAATFLNGHKTHDVTGWNLGGGSPSGVPLGSAPAVTDMLVMSLDTNFVWESGMRFPWIAFWDRVLSDAEIRTASEALLARFSVQRKLMLILGTSITAGFNWPNTAATNFTTPARVAANWGVPGYQFSSADNATIDSFWTGPTLSDEKFILFDIGTNDLRFTYATNPSGMTTAYAAWIDARKAAAGAGVKTVCSTILPREESIPAGVQFNTDRATANTTIRSWAGGRCDVIADLAADPTMGANGASLNATYYPDEIHPSAAGSAILATIEAAAVNTVP